MWAPSAVSVIAGNHQYDSDGILVQQNYVVADCTGCTMQGYFQSFLDIRWNAVDGEYDWPNDCSASGIGLGVASAPWGDSLPPTVGFGVSIAHNAIRHADHARHGGAIAQLQSLDTRAGTAPLAFERERPHPSQFDQRYRGCLGVADMRQGDTPRRHRVSGNSHSMAYRALCQLVQERISAHRERGSEYDQGLPFARGRFLRMLGG